MAYAYIVLNRNDLADNALQVLDLKPNTSQLGIYDSVWPNQGGQTGYLTHEMQNDVVATTAGAGGIETTNAAYNGLAAYLIDNVEDVQDGNLALTDALAIAIAAAIQARVEGGLGLTLANINTIINTEIGGAANSDLDGTAAGSWSTGAVEEILRILAGEVYQLPAASQVGDAANAFPGHGVGHTALGGFLASTATGYRYVRKFAETGSFNLSALSGALSKLKAATYSWINPSYTYGATGTALTAAGTNIPVTGVAAAVRLFDDDGNVL